MGSEFLWIDALGSKEAERQLKEYERSNNRQKAKEFLKTDGWRLLRDSGLYEQRIPFWKVLEAYQFTFEQHTVIYDLIRSLKLFKKNGEELSTEFKEQIIADIEAFGTIKPDASEKQLDVIKFCFQKCMAMLFNSGLDKAEAIAILNNAGAVQQKAVHGLPMPQLVQPYSVQYQPAPLPQKPEVAPHQEEAGLEVPSREKALSLAGEWYASGIDNKALYVGLLILNGKTNREIYAKVWGVPLEQVPSGFASSLRYQRNKFLEYARDKGYDFRPFMPEDLRKK